DRRIHAARDHRVQDSSLNIAKRVSDGVGRRGAAGRNDVAQTAKSKPHRNFTGQRPNGTGGNRINAALLLLTGVVEPVLLFGEILAAAAGTDNHADAA